MKMTSFSAVLLCFFFTLEARAATCNVNTTAVSFGSYDVFSITPTDSTGTITILCDASINVLTDIGQSPNSGGFNPRKMKHTSLADLLSYNLFTDTARTVIWGNGTGGTSAVTQKATKNKSLNLTVYGRMPQGQDISGGLYGETLTVTITY